MLSDEFTNVRENAISSYWCNAVPTRYPERVSLSKRIETQVC